MTIFFIHNIKTYRKIEEKFFEKDILYILYKNIEYF